MRLERCGVAVLLPVSCSWYLPLAPFTLWRSGEDIILISKIGCAGRDLNPRPLAYEASELPDCSTAQFFVCLLSKNGGIIAYAAQKVKGKKYTLPFVVGRALRCGGMNRDSSRSQRNQLEFAVALASEDVSVGSMVAVILL